MPIELTQPSLEGWYLTLIRMFWDVDDADLGGPSPDVLGPPVSRRDTSAGSEAIKRSSSTFVASSPKMELMSSSRGLTGDLLWSPSDPESE